MGKDGGVMTAKAIGKRIKAKGLGRLRWYCQMCEKQCRDENGFKCHTNTPAHQRQLELFAERPDLFVERFSSSFLKGFLSVLYQRYGSNAVSANNVYQDYIKDRDHIHMNSTKWITLTEFVKDIGRLGYCRVEDRDGTWWISYIDREAVERKERAEAFDRARLEEEERAERYISRQMQTVDSSSERSNSPPQGTMTNENEMNKSVEITLPVERLRRARRGHSLGAQLSNSPDFQPGEEVFETLSSSQKATMNSGEWIKRSSRFAVAPSQKPTVLDEIIAQGRDKNGAANASSAITRPVPRHTERVVQSGAFSQGSRHSPCKRGDEMQSGRLDVQRKDDCVKPPDYWIRPGIIVKVISRELEEGPYYRKKGLITSLKDRYTAHVRLLESSALIQLDQDDLETVIPKPGGLVTFVKGHHRGEYGILLDITEDSYSVSVRLEDTGNVIRNIEYDEISKAAPPESKVAKENQ